MKPQIWFCEKCGTIGVVMVKDGDGVYDVVGRIREMHVTYKPACLAAERVIVPDELKTNKIICAGR